MKTLTSWGALAVALGAAGAVAAQAPPDPAAALRQSASASVQPLGYAPLFQFAAGGMELQLPILITERVEGVSDIPLDVDQNRWSADPTWNTQVRVGARLDTVFALKPARLVAELEVDALTGQHLGGAVDPGLGVDLPDSGDAEAQLRKASLRLDLGYHLHLLGGATTSHWGMGLLANDGAHGGEFGSAQFLDPRGGDRVLRGMMIVGPFTDARLAFFGAIDRVLGDDILVGDGDEAFQGIIAAALGFGQERHAGIYFVSRRQESADGKLTLIQALDAEGTYHRDLGDGHQIDLQAEAALILGTTQLAPSPDFGEHDVRQLGAAARFGYHIDNAGLWLDLLYASGDNNFDDDVQSGFRLDPNFPQGLLLHRYVVAAQTARAPITAADPELVGQPAQDLDRLPTRGSVANTISIFPRAYVKFWDRLELFGGPLFAFAERDLADPLQTRLAGGDPRNALGGAPGAYLGTEIDLGARYRLYLSTAEVTLGVEGGVLLPGSAFEDAQGDTIDNVSGGRAWLRLRL
jgi:hypothetical protein